MLDKTGRFIWHDHRMHWMGTKNPPQVKSESKKTKIFDYGIPISLASQKAKVTGTLWWVGPNNSFPILPFAILALLVAITIPVVIRRRRRVAAAAAATEPAPEVEREREPVSEAW